ncbi:hypothetical protein GCM10027343_27170 [Noviherbaspirillum agri]
MDTNSITSSIGTSQCQVRLRPGRAGLDAETSDLIDMTQVVFGDARRAASSQAGQVYLTGRLNPTLPAHFGHHLMRKSDSRKAIVVNHTCEARAVP